MAPECNTIRYLRQLVLQQDPNDPGLAKAAAATLNIISDITEYSMTDYDIEALHDIVDELAKSGHQIILTHLVQGAPDCRICAALAHKINTLGMNLN